MTGCDHQLSMIMVQVFEWLTPKYLSTDMDERLGVSNHVTRMSEKIETLLLIFTRFSKEIWDQDSKTLLTILAVYSTGIFLVRKLS